MVLILYKFLIWRKAVRLLSPLLVTYFCIIAANETAIPFRGFEGMGSESHTCVDSEIMYIVRSISYKSTMS